MIYPTSMTQTHTDALDLAKRYDEASAHDARRGLDWVRRNNRIWRSNWGWRIEERFATDRVEHLDREDNVLPPARLLIHKCHRSNGDFRRQQTVESGLECRLLEDVKRPV